MNIAARAGRWSAAHWKTATFGWLTLVICALAVGNMAGTVGLTNSEQSTGESARAQAILTRSGFHDHAGESVLVASRGFSAADREFRREVQIFVSRLRQLGEIQGIRSPLSPGNRGQISKNGHSALIEFDMKGDSDSAGDRVQPVLNAVAPRWSAASPARGRSL